MSLRYERAIRRINRLPRSQRMLLTAMLIVLMCWQVELFGEKLGKALYYLTH